jgi:hypothetical protein
LALADGMEIIALIALLQCQNEGRVNQNLSRAGAGQSGMMARNALFTRLIVMVTREFSSSRECDMHIGRAFDLLNGDTRAIFEGIGSAAEMAAAIGQWQRLRGDHRLQSLSHFRDKQTAHLGVKNDSIPAITYSEVFGFAQATVDLVDQIAAATRMANVKIRATSTRSRRPRRSGSRGKTGLSPD